MSSASGQLAFVAIGFVLLVAIFVVLHKRRSGWSWGDFIVEASSLLGKALVSLLTEDILFLFGGEGTGRPAPSALAKREQGDEGDGPRPPLTAAPSGGAGGDPRLRLARRVTVHEIANSELTLADIPPPGASWRVVNKFALTFNGYKAWGSFQKCAEIANAQRHESLTRVAAGDVA